MGQVVRLLQTTALLRAGGLLTVLLLTAGVLLTASCKQELPTDESRSVYYWRTAFRLTPSERHFLTAHQVNRMYLRFFDVVTADGQAVPNATIAFDDSIPCGMEVVPVVFITNDCMFQHHDSLASRIARRIVQMCQAHDVHFTGEVQIDCDWTLSTRNNFFAFLEELRREPSVAQLSVTIRLHQLSQPAPPADRGVLMVYNTGDFRQLACHKPILDPEAVAPYLHALSSYPLPLAPAYPVFRWDVLFRGDRYVGILHAPDELPVLQGDSVAVREPRIDDILRAKQMVESKLNRNDESGNGGGETVLFDLSPQSIQRFNPYDYETIFSH